jgi:hypothetical protein
VVSALTAIVASIRSGLRYDEIMRILSALSAERSRIAAHETSIGELSGQFQRLQGRFYAAQRKNSEPEPEIDRPRPAAADLKSQLRKQIGLVPGRRP